MVFAQYFAWGTSQEYEHNHSRRRSLTSASEIRLCKSAQFSDNDRGGPRFSG